MIICTHNRLEDLDICIKSLVDQVTTEMGHIMIVDSCSDQHIADQIVKMVETYSNVSYHRANEPGLSLARNLGIAKGASDWVAFLDDDIIADPHYFKNLVCRIDMIPNDFGIIGGQVVGQKSSGDPLPDLGPRWKGLLSLIEEQNDLKDPSFPAVGANVIYRRANLPADAFSIELGRKGTFSLVGGEEVRLEMGLRNRGVRSYYDSRILVHHRVQPERLDPEWALRRAYWGGYSHILSIDKSIQKIPFKFSLSLSILKLLLLLVMSVFDSHLYEWRIRRNYVWGMVRGHLN
ncbi:MAG: glycosyltransferase family 2 protein [Roseovarius gahaiensis]